MSRQFGVGVSNPFELLENENGDSEVKPQKAPKAAAKAPAAKQPQRAIPGAAPPAPLAPEAVGTYTKPRTEEHAQQRANRRGRGRGEGGEGRGEGGRGAGRGGEGRGEGEGRKREFDRRTAKTFERGTRSRTGEKKNATGGQGNWEENTAVLHGSVEAVTEAVEATGENAAAAAAAPETPAADAEPKVEEFTLAEYEAQLAAKRPALAAPAPRRANEGSDQSKWQGYVALKRTEDNDKREVTVQRGAVDGGKAVKKKNDASHLAAFRAVDVSSNEGEGGRGRGRGRGGRGRGAGRGRGDGAPRDGPSTPRRDEAAAPPAEGGERQERPAGRGNGGRGGGGRGGDSRGRGRGGGGRAAASGGAGPKAPAISDESAFPTLGKA